MDPGKRHPTHSFAVCSDAEVGKKRNKDEDIVETFAHELRYPATTDAKRLYMTATPRIYAHLRGFRQGHGGEGQRRHLLHG